MNFQFVSKEFQIEMKRVFRVMNKSLWKIVELCFEIGKVYLLYKRSKWNCFESYQLNLCLKIGRVNPNWNGNRFENLWMDLCETGWNLWIESFCLKRLKW